MHIRNTGKLTTVANKHTKISLASIALLGDLSPHFCTREKCSVCQWMNWRFHQEERKVDLKTGLLVVAWCSQWKQREIEEWWVGKVIGFTPMETEVDFWPLHFWGASPNSTSERKRCSEKEVLAQTQYLKGSLNITLTLSQGLRSTYNERLLCPSDGPDLLLPNALYVN